MHIPPQRTAEQAFEPHASSVSAARRFVTSHLEQWDHGKALWTVQLLLSELATNAVLHAGGSGFTVGVQVLADGAVRLTVADESSRPPRLRDYGTGATTGRGVALVDELARGWGVDARSTGTPDGKVVWCEVVAEPPRLRLVDDDETDEATPDLDSFLGPDDADVPTAQDTTDVRVAA